MTRKPCSLCSFPRYAKGLCKRHYYQANPLKRAPLVKKPYRIKPVSDKQKKRLAVYRKEKALFLEEVTVCQFPGCESTYATLHHARGRIGDNLTNRETFRNLCWVHHNWAEEHPEEAKALNLSESRLSNC